ncbi:TolC family protein [Microbacterium sp. MC2]
MDPVFLAALAEFWWVAPAAAGAGALGWFGVRAQRAENARRLEYDAARNDLRAARGEVARARASVKVARAEFAQVQAERTAGRATPADVAAARRELQRAEQEARAAGAGVRSRRAQVSAARASLQAQQPSDPATLPLGRLMAAHDAVIARWLDYETDAAKVLAFPAMSDARQPATAAFLTASSAAQQLRPASPQTRISTTQFSEYRDAVRALERAFNAAEEHAWQQARAGGSVPPGARPHPSAASPAIDWADMAQTAIAKGADALARAAEAARQMMDARKHDDRDHPTPPDSGR